MTDDENASAEVSAFAHALLTALHGVGEDPPGVTRPAFSPAENAAHELIRDRAVALGLEVATDVLGHSYATLPGRDRTAPRLLTGSHLDSVPHGGDFDGTAGVVAGLAALRELAKRGVAPARDVTVMAIRAEEACWFAYSYLGSRAAFGLVPPGEAKRLRRCDDGATLAQHVAAIGLDARPFVNAEATLKPADVAAFIELHIEQGPQLVAADVPVGIVTGIRGNLRYRGARVVGEHSHAGAVPRGLRRDALFAGVELAAAMEAFWDDCERRGDDFVCTFGEFGTDPAFHAMTKIAGELAFTLDMRSLDEAVLARADAHLREVGAAVAGRRGVHVEIPSPARGPAVRMDERLRGLLQDAAKARAIRACDIASGAGHDAATFAAEGVPTAMLFVRNRNGSHNPDEQMDLADLAGGVAILADTLEALATASDA